MYEERVKFYTPFLKRELPDIKKAALLTKEQIKERECEAVLKCILKEDYIVLLDVQGEKISSEEFAQKIEKWRGRGLKRLMFVIGGAYGFSQALYGRADERLSLSSMTFSHQMVRLLFLEQLYRACTIINKEPYHHK